MPEAVDCLCRKAKHSTTKTTTSNSDGCEVCRDERKSVAPGRRIQVRSIIRQTPLFSTEEFAQYLLPEIRGLDIETYASPPQT